MEFTNILDVLPTLANKWCDQGDAKKQHLASRQWKGGDLMASMKRKNRNSHHEERRITIRGVRRDPPDIHKLSKALIGLAMAEAERQAQAEQAQRDANAKGTSAADGQGADPRE